MRLCAPILGVTVCRKGQFSQLTVEVPPELMTELTDRILLMLSLGPTNHRTLVVINLSPEAALVLVEYLEPNTDTPGQNFPFKLTTTLTDQGTGVMTIELDKALAFSELLNGRYHFLNLFCSWDGHCLEGYLLEQDDLIDLLQEECATRVAA